MKKILYITAILSTLLLTSCQDMFNKMIEYNGEEEDPVLCINAEIVVGQAMKVFVTRSWFFLDESRYVGNPQNMITRRGIVRDADVQMQVNDGEWQPLTFVYIPDTILYDHVTERASYYTSDYSFQAGDKVTIRAQHPDFATVTATEIVPAKPETAITFNEQRENVFSFTISVDKLPRQSDDVIFFYVVGFGHCAYMWADNIEEVADGYTFDSVAECSPLVFQRIYSEDFMFSEFNLPRTNHGFYTQNGPLYTTASHFSNGGGVTILLDCAKYNFNGVGYSETLGKGFRSKEEGYPSLLGMDEYYLDSVYVRVRLSNESFYMYRTTLLANSGSSSSRGPEISLYSNDGEESGYGNIFDDISEIFSELGVQEGYQAYTNVEGGFGHFCFLNQSGQIVHAGGKLDITNDYNYDYD